MKKNIKIITILTVLALSSVLLLSACTTSDVSEKESTTQGTTTVIPISHTLSEDPVQMEGEDKELSLEGYGAIGALADEDLSLADMLMYAVQDEYLAHGEYVAIISEFGSQNPYANIVKSEESHLSYLEQIYDSYDMTFPEDTSEEHLIIPKDLLEAAKTGVQAEIDNIAMYEKFLSYDLPEDVKDVFNALKKGSESHLLAFEKQVDRLSK